MFRVITATAVFAIFFATAGTCVAVDSAVTIATATATKNAGFYDVAATGTMTLGTGDTYVGSQAFLTKPDGSSVPMFLNVTPPTAGNSSNYTATLNVVAGMAGNWKLTVKMSYIHGGNNMEASQFVTLQMP